MLDFQGQPGGHGHLAVAELLRRFGDSGQLFRGEFAVAGDDPAVEAVRGVLVPQEAQALHPGDFLGGYRGAGSSHPHLVEGGGALQHQGVLIAIELQPVLQEVGTLAPAAHQQQLLLLADAFDGALHLGEVHELGAPDGGLGIHVDDGVALGRPGGVLGGGHALHGAGELVLQHIHSLHKGWMAVEKGGA